MARNEYREGSFKGWMPSKGSLDVRSSWRSYKKYENSSFRKKMRKNDLIALLPLEKERF
jgi:hypothetical protein